jgi:hypothetical protein
MPCAADKVVWCDQGMFPVSYGFCPSETAWRRQMRAWKVRGTPYPGTSGCTFPFYDENDKGDETSGYLEVLVTLDPPEDIAKDPIMVIGLMAHEATHVWQEIRSHMQEQNPSSEFEAYAVQHITQELLSAFQKTRGRRFQLMPHRAPRKQKAKR